MKRISLVFFASLVALPLFAQTREVYDKSVFEAELDQFETYDIGDMASLTDETFVTENQLIGSMLENAISYEMDVYNYRMDKEKPEMLINYMVFDQKYSDKVGYMPGFRIDEDFGMDDNILNDVKDGSIAITVVRIKDGKAVWSGYVTDGIDPSASLREQQRDARQVASAIMEAFMADVNFDGTAATIEE